MSAIKEKYFLQRLRIKQAFSRGKKTPLTLPLRIPQAPRFIVCLPDREEDLLTIQNYLPSFIHHFASGTFFLVVNRSFETFFAAVPSVRILPFSPDDFSSVGILKKQWVAQIPKNIFMAIDFNTTNRLWSEYLCYSSQAPVRISFKKPRVADFFNIILHPNQNNDFQKQVGYLLRIIQDLTRIKKETLVNDAIT
ncbi:MAG: glycosyltransferase family 9 protein [Calditrichaeota bacterium]|nr:glycosyltransferase family 9 protein [Calditrichota bacterium]